VDARSAMTGSTSSWPCFPVVGFDQQCSCRHRDQGVGVDPAVGRSHPSRGPQSLRSAKLRPRPLRAGIPGLSASTVRTVLVDREIEREARTRLQDLGPSRFGAAVVLRGEAGIGKKSLLEYALGASDGLRVARVVGIESEIELGFAAVHQLIRPFHDVLRGCRRRSNRRWRRRSGRSKAPRQIASWLAWPS
jgi:hypothetical protein